MLEQLADAIAAALHCEESLPAVTEIVLPDMAPVEERRETGRSLKAQVCAKPERCAQPVMRRSSTAITQYITMPSTASAISPAKISGTWNCACACSIRLPMPLLEATLSEITVAQQAVPAWVQRGIPGAGQAALEPLVGSWRVELSIYGTMGRH